MPKELAKDLPDRLEAEVSRHSAGIAVGKLVELFDHEASRRSITRMLGGLVRRHRIRVEGTRRGTKYLPPAAPTPPGVREPDRPTEPAEVYVPLTGESPTLREWVRRPITLRRPVGYDRKLLDSYIPNQSFYLTDGNWRRRLREIGRSPAGERPAGTYARDVLDRLLIDLSWASSHLEGNTYSRLDTQNLIENGREAEGKDRLETQMILNHKRAIEFLVDNAGETGFDMYTFLNLHSLLSDNLLRDPAAGGRLRRESVEIAGSVYLPLQVPQQIEDLFRRILEKAKAIADPFEQAFFLMVHIPYLQPFEDVNKRVSRLAANIPFIKANLCPLSFVDVPERAYVEGTMAVYEHGRVDLLRDVFTWAYERSCQRFKAIAGALPEPDAFRLKYREELKEAVQRVVLEARQNTLRGAKSLAKELVPEEDQQKFATMLSDELHHLHEGNIARYRLRLSEFRAWRAKQGSA